jgi:hypothetical protein
MLLEGVLFDGVVVAEDTSVMLVNPAMVQIGMHLFSGHLMLFLVVALEREGMIGDALAILEQALETSHLLRPISVKRSRSRAV